jgi:hypothetical protein
MEVEGAKDMAKHLLLNLALGVVLATGVSAFAAPPGPIDGVDIPTDFGGVGNAAALQTNRTGWGKSFERYAATGSELNRMWVAQGQDGGVDYLYIGITGNLQTGGNQLMIFIQDANTNGQNVLKTELCGGPPYALQDMGAETAINTNGTPDPADDFLERTGAFDGAKFDEGATAAETFAPTRAITIDLFNADINVSLYRMRENPMPGLTYDDAGTIIVETLPVYATRCYLGQGAVNNGLGDLSGGGPGYPDTECTDQGYSLADWQIAVDGRNTLGVNGVDLTGDPATATLGFEVRAPLADLALTRDQTIKVLALITGGTGGAVSNQSLPTMQVDAPNWDGRWPQINLDDDQNLGWDGDQFATVDLQANDVGAAAPAFDGQLLDAVYNTTTLVAEQGTWTKYGDQTTANNVEVVVENELDGMWIDNDSQNLYIGLTGNTSGGNRMLIYFDTLPPVSGERTLIATNANNGGGAVGGMTGRGHSLPKRTDDSEPGYDYAIEVNESGGNVYVDLRILEDGAEGSAYLGFSTLNSTDGLLQTGTNPNDMRVAYNTAALDITQGVPGCDDFDPVCFNLTPAQVEAAAATKTTGYEYKIPFADIGISPVAQPTIDIWAMIVNGGGDWGSDQSLPSLRADSPDMKVTVADQVSVDFTRPTFPDSNRNYNARSVQYTLASDTTPPQLLAGQSFKDHGAALGSLAIDIPSGVQANNRHVIEPRQGSVTDLDLAFDEELDPATVIPGNFNVCGLNSTPGNPVTAVLDGTGTVVTLAFADGQIPNGDANASAGDAYVLVVGPGVTDLAGNPIDAAADRIYFAASYGNTKSDGVLNNWKRVNSQDRSQIVLNLTATPTAAQAIAYDVRLQGPQKGKINAQDVSTVVLSFSTTDLDNSVLPTCP